MQNSKITEYTEKDKVEITDAGNNQVNIGPYRVSYYAKDTTDTSFFHGWEFDRVEVTYDGGKKYETKISISNMVEFYITIPNTIKNIEKIEIITKQDTFAKARIALFNGGAGGQNIMIFRGEEFQYARSEELELPKEKKGQIEVIKKDSNDGTKLSGVKFKLYNAAGTQIGTEYITDANGKFTTIELDEGNYYLVETQASNQYYEVDSTHHNVTVKSGEIVSTEITNTKKYADLVINKKDSQSGKLISGMVFTIQKKGGERSGEYLTGTGTTIDQKYSKTEVKIEINGSKGFDKILPGNYEIKEVGVGKNTYYEPVGVIASPTIVVGTKDTIELENTKKYADLVINKKDSQSGASISGMVFTIQKKGGERDGEYLTGTGTTMDQKYSKTEVKIEINGSKGFDKVLAGKYEIKEVGVGNNVYYEPVGVIATPTVVSGAKSEIKLENTKVKGDFKIVKTGKDSGKPLSNVEFTLKMTKGKKVGQYVNSKGEYSTQKVTIKTDSKGEISIPLIYTGEYELIETNVGSVNEKYGYVVNANPGSVTIEGGKLTTKNIENERKYIKVSGYVWEDQQIEEGKKFVRDNLYTGEDNLFEGITVKLMKGAGEILDSATTNSKGEYIFEKVEIKDLDSIYVEFEYNGLKYFTVSKDLTKENGSKAIDVDRQAYDNKFRKITNDDGSKNAGEVKDLGNKKSFDLKYDIVNNEAKLNFENKEYNIVANTKTAGYKFKEQYDKSKNDSGKYEYLESISGTNFGIYEKQQADLAVVQDVENIKIVFNGMTHTYNYGDKMTPKGDTDIFGVQFKNEYTGEYTREVYAADVQQNLNNDSNEFKMYLTYDIIIKNEAIGVDTRINSITNYYDKNYIIKSINGKEISANEQGKEANNKYNKIDIELNSKIPGINGGNESNVTIIPIVYEIEKTTVEGFMKSDGELLDCITEVKSFSNFYANTNNCYSAIDKDSNPNNLVLSNNTTYEDDTDKAPGIKITEAQERTITGNIFEDNAKVVDGTREGNGKYDEEDTKLDDNVTVTLMNQDGTVFEYKDEDNVTSKYISNINSDGTYIIENIPAGKYKLKFTWGGKYDVQQYKSTIYKDVDDEFWYRDAEPRYSDATDDYTIRQEIDQEINSLDFTTFYMDAYTAPMTLKIENLDKMVTELSENESLNYNIKNVDFGIVERPRQSIKVDKVVEHIKLTLQNGQTLVDSDIINGTLEPKPSNVAYLPESENSKGFLKIEMDEEIIQGSNLEITYGIKVTNNSEIDYINESFYKYGTKGGDKTNIVTIESQSIIDAMSDNLVFSNETNGDWEVVEFNKLYENYTTRPVISEQQKYFDGEVSIGNTKYTREKFWTEINTDGSTVKQSFESELKQKRTEEGNDLTYVKNEILNQTIPAGETKAVEFKASKMLSNQSEIEMDNKVEVLKVEKNGGSRVISEIAIVKDYAETVMVTPPTGENRNYYVCIIPIIIGLTTIAATVIMVEQKRKR